MFQFRDCAPMFQFRDCPSLSCGFFHDEFLSSDILRRASIQWTRLVNTRTKRSGFQVFRIQELSDYAFVIPNAKCDVTRYCVTLLETLSDVASE
jgi:hypothetical protein